MNLIQIFTYGNPNSILQTTNGKVAYINWLQARKKEFEKLGRIAEIRYRKNIEGIEYVGMFANDITIGDPYPNRLNVKNLIRILKKYRCFPYG